MTEGYSALSRKRRGDPDTMNEYEVTRAICALYCLHAYLEHREKKRSKT